MVDILCQLLVDCYFAFSNLSKTPSNTASKQEEYEKNKPRQKQQAKSEQSDKRARAKLFSEIRITNGANAYFPKQKEQF